MKETVKENGSLLCIMSLAAVFTTRNVRDNKKKINKTSHIKHKFNIERNKH